MQLSTQIKAISYLKAHTAEIVHDLEQGAAPIVITQNGEAKMVVQSVRDFEQNQETLALLKILTLGNLQIEKGEVQSSVEVFKSIKKD